MLAYAYFLIFCVFAIGLPAWSRTYYWPDSMLSDVMDFAGRQFLDAGSSHRITAIRCVFYLCVWWIEWYGSLISSYTYDYTCRHFIELLYGSQMSNSRDKRILITLLATFVSSNALKPDFYLTTVSTVDNVRSLIWTHSWRHV